MKFYIVSTILSILFILLSYYGISRYIYLCYTGCDTFVSSYTNLDKADKNNRVVIGISSLKDSQNPRDLVPTINSLLNQSVKTDEIGIYTRSNKQFGSCVSDYVNIYSDVSNSNPFPALTESLKKEVNGNTKIILLSDSAVYGSDLIEELVSASNNHPNAIIYEGSSPSLSRGILIQPKLFDPSIINIELINDKTVDIIEWLKLHTSAEFIHTGSNVDTYKRI